jgi:chitinase
MAHGIGTVRFFVFLLLLCCAMSSAWAQTTKKTGPFAGAGPDQRVDDGAKVLLAGNGSVDQGRVVKFAWAQVSGPAVELRRPNRSTANFTAPRVKTITPLKFRLTVTDDRGRSGSSVVTVTVVPRHAPKPPDTPSG